MRRLVSVWVGVVLALLVAASGCTLPPSGGDPDPEGWRRYHGGSLSFDVRPAVLEGAYGDRVAFTLRLVRGAAEEVRLASGWGAINGTAGATPIALGSEVEGWVIAGAAPQLLLDTREHGLVVGPAVGASANATLPGHLYRDPVDAPPGLSHANGTLRYASPTVRTTTADWDMTRVNDWAYVDGAIVGLVGLFANDAVAPLDRPERPHIDVDTSWLPRGPVEVRAVVSRSCFCLPTEPTVETLHVELE